MMDVREYVYHVAKSVHSPWWLVWRLLTAWRSLSESENEHLIFIFEVYFCFLKKLSSNRQAVASHLKHNNHLL
jgi:hypothetical protein